jgi:SHS family sialic acid transporter-like MFS transporter
MNAPVPPRGKLYLTLVAAFLGWMFDGMEMGIFPIVAGPALEEMAPHLRGAELKTFVSAWMGWATALFLWGAALGGVIFGWLGDKIGRVRAMSWSILAYSVFTGLGYFATEPWHLPAFRFVAALGMGGEWALGVALVMEIWPEDKRPLLAGVIGAASNVGFALIAVLAIVFPVMKESWRWVMLVGAAPALLTFFIRLFVPESERWRAAVRKGPSHPLSEIFRPPLLRRTVLAILLSSVVLIVTWGAIQWLALLGQERAGSALPQAKGVTQAVSSVGAIFGCLLGAWLGKYSRRGAYALLCILSFGVCTYLFRSTRYYDFEFMVLVLLAGLTTASFYGWLPLYLPELFPTRVRATAQGLSFNLGRVFAGVGALQMGSLVEQLGGSYDRAGATIVLVYVVGLVVIWFAPETRGRPLPE